MATVSRAAVMVGHVSLEVCTVAVSVGIIADSVSAMAGNVSVAARKVLIAIHKTHGAVRDVAAVVGALYFAVTAIHPHLVRAYGFILRCFYNPTVPVSRRHEQERADGARVERDAERRRFTRMSRQNTRAAPRVRQFFSS